MQFNWVNWHSSWLQFLVIVLYLGECELGISKCPECLYIIVRCVSGHFILGLLAVCFSRSCNVVFVDISGNFHSSFSLNNLHSVCSSGSDNMVISSLNYYHDNHIAIMERQRDKLWNRIECAFFVIMNAAGCARAYACVWDLIRNKHSDWI